MKIAIVGAGVSGIAMGVALRRAGFEDFEILERAEELGGVWQQNTYPGACCDVPSYLYSYSYAQRRSWSRPCSPQEEIQEYLREVAANGGILERIRTGVEVESATWQRESMRWRLETRAGERIEADALVLACGQLSRPSWPPIEGVTEFAGHSFHSADWDHEHELAGRRVAVIGTGASAIQFIPHVAERAAHVDVFQRSAPYMLPRRNPAYPSAVRRLIERMPGLQALRRIGMSAFMELCTLGLLRLPPLRWALRAWSTCFMRLQLRGEPELRRRAWPDYACGCKRILFSSSYLPALRRPDVELVTEPIERLSERGVVTAAGEREVDTIIYGTGFRADEFVAPLAVRGRDGIELQQSWSDGAEAHLGITVAGFPNMFLLYGPNTNLGVGSIIVMVEAQAGYVAEALRALGREGAAAISVRPEVQAASSAKLQERLDGSIWTQCQSWYRQDGRGRVVNNWPGLMAEYRRATRRVDLDEYSLEGGRPTRAS